MIDLFKFLLTIATRAGSAYITIILKNMLCIFSD